MSFSPFNSQLKIDAIVANDYDKARSGSVNIANYYAQGQKIG